MHTGSALLNHQLEPCLRLCIRCKLFYITKLSDDIKQHICPTCLDKETTHVDRTTLRKERQAIPAQL